ncbi:MAG: hypothetical protein WBI41_06480 [Azovibrio sp.]|uniref:hypothetical protein n=1 Tax=Azovibrio sp. TaxID=1872673 RepID=UPI003C7725F1
MSSLGNIKNLSGLSNLSNLSNLPGVSNGVLSSLGLASAQKGRDFAASDFATLDFAALDFAKSLNLQLARMPALAGLGPGIDPDRNLLSLDPARRQQALAANREEAVNTLQQFSKDFFESAKMPDAQNDLIPDRQVDLDRVMNFIAGNPASRQPASAQGDMARPPAYVAQALAAYTRMSRGF